MKYVSRRSDQDDDLDLDWVEGDIGSMSQDELYRVAKLDCEDCDSDVIEVEIIAIDEDDEEEVLGEFVIRPKV